MEDGRRYESLFNGRFCRSSALFLMDEASSGFEIPLGCANHLFVGPETVGLLEFPSANA